MTGELARLALVTGGAADGGVVAGGRASFGRADAKVGVRWVPQCILATAFGGVGRFRHVGAKNGVNKRPRFKAPGSYGLDLQGGRAD